MDLISLPLKTIELDLIDTAFAPFSFSYGFELDPLINSIKKIGLINSPIVKEEKDRFIIVTGYKRVLALKEIKIDKVKCRLISNKISPLQLFLISLYDNLPIRRFNEMEKAIILLRLSKYLTYSEIIQEYMPLLSLPKHRPLLELYLWMNELNDKAKELISKGRLSIKTLKILFEWDIPKRDVDIYVGLIDKLKFSFNEQRQLIEYSQNICKKENISLKDFFIDSGVEEIIEDFSLNNADKIKKILTILREKNFPRLSMAEKIFRKKVKSLGLPYGVSISAPSYFEAPLYRLEISFREGRELKEKIEKLNNIKGLEDIKDPWKE